VSVASDAAFMRRALELARRGRVGTHPNPMVGAVIVRAGAVVGEGWHGRYGGPHAEVEALRAAGDAARGATLYVTLEPCAHHGKTPPCADAVIAAGITRVVIAVDDPNPAAMGGVERLRAAGIDVVRDVERDAARSLNAAFFHVHERGAPFFALKLALSLDGRIAAAPGQRTAITGAEALRETHRLRAAHDAVLVGSGTARVDDPLLTVRDLDVSRQPARVVVDTAAALSLSSQLVATAADAPVWVICAQSAPDDRVRCLEDAGVAVLRTDAVTGADGRPRIDPAALPPLLAGRGVRAVLVEGGAAMASALLASGLINRQYLFVAPSLVGSGGVHAFALDVPPPGSWSFAAIERFGADVLLTLDPAPAPVENI
jgi:diaminohydroxyphosphoribosylaminopyrimidine deaminase / 5-amino-6-(5-phosphoribosylamino)uracil reductase